MVTGRKQRLPVWAIGLANMPTGFVFGFISTAMGILLASRHVSVERITQISAVAFSPTFSAWLLSPVLDVRFTKRAYGYFLAVLAGLLLIASVLAIGNLGWFTALITASCAAATLYSSAVQSWGPDAVGETEHAAIGGNGHAATGESQYDMQGESQYDAMSGWFIVANLGAAGVFSALAVVLVRWLPLGVAATLLGLLVIAPTVLLRYFPAPPEPEGTLRRNFAAMVVSLRRVLREGRVWVALTMFLLPVGAFALTNVFSSLGAEFGVPESWVTGLNGPGVAAVCSAGALLGIPLCRRWRRRTVYLVAATGAAASALAMGLLPHSLPVYAGGLLAYNLSQGLNFTAFLALEMEIIGPKNALAGTMMAVLTASGNVPISFMTWVDGRVQGHHGLNAMFFVDAGSAILAAAALWFIVLPWLDKWIAKRDARGVVLE